MIPDEPWRIRAARALISIGICIGFSPFHWKLSAKRPSDMVIVYLGPFMFMVTGPFGD